MDNQNEFIASLYQKQLEIPESKTTVPFLLCPVGLVGAGKTTVLKPLAKEFSLVRISNDEIRQLMIEHAIEQNDEAVHAISYGLAKKYLSMGYGIAIDANCSSKKEFLNKISVESNLPLVWICINPPEEFILNKLRNYKHGTLFKDADEAIGNYFRSKAERAEMDKGIPFVYTFDTSKEDLPDQIAEAITAIKAKLYNKKELE